MRSNVIFVKKNITVCNEFGRVIIVAKCRTLVAYWSSQPVLAFFDAMFRLKSIHLQHMKLHIEDPEKDAV